MVYLLSDVCLAGTVNSVMFAKGRRFRVMVSLSDFQRLNSSALKTAGTAATVNPGRNQQQA